MTGRLSASSAPGQGPAPSPQRFAGWEARIYPGLQLASAPTDARRGLASALGAAGVEAEYLLRLLADFPGAGGPSREAGEALLDGLDAFAARLAPLAAELEVATQGYISAITEDAPVEGRPAPGSAAVAEPWWPPFSGWTLDGESFGLRLRRCGFSYRQVVAVRLPDTVDAVAERMALVLHALASLPPAGTLPVAALSQGLGELADAVQGDVALRFIRDLSAEYLGLPSAIARLRRLAASEDTSLAADITWARQQYAAAAEARPSGSGVFARLFGSGAGRKPPESSGTTRWAEEAAREWRELIAALEALRTTGGTRPPGGTGRR